MDILKKIKKSKIKKDYLKIKTIDMHTGGEPLRVIIDGFPKILGKTILEKRKYIQDNLDYLRTTLMFEPRGHADMYGVLIVEAENDDSVFGVIFMHNEGYSTMCGHATIAITKLAVELGWVKSIEPITNIKIDAPCGQLDCFANINNGEVTNVSFNSVPSFVVSLNETVEVEGIGKVVFNLSYGGAFYAFVDAQSLGLSLDKENYDKIIFYSRKIKDEIIKNKNNIKHPFEKDLSFLYGIIFITDSLYYHSKNVCVFADSEVDRSPTGSGVSGRVAIHYKKNELLLNESITIESILESTFDVKVIKEVKYGDFDAVIAQVTGTAYITGKHTFLVDKKDELKHGFLLR